MWERIKALIFKEFITTLKDPKSRLLIIMPPLLQLLIFAHAATMEIKNVDVAIFDQSNTYESRELISGFRRSVWFNKVLMTGSEDEVGRLIRTQKVHMGILIQSDFAKNLKSGRQSHVQIIVDGRQTNTASIASNYASEIISSFERQYKKYSTNGSGTARINTISRSWFNPNLEYIHYTLVSLVALLSFAVALLLTAMSIARERELGTFDQLIVSPLSAFEILVGKTVPPLVITIFLNLVIVLSIVVFFKVPFEGSILLLIFSTAISLLSVVGIGLFISSFCKTQQQALLSVFLFQMPMVLLSGYISPVNNMPVFLQYATYLNPMRFYLVIIKGLFLKNMGFVDVTSNLIPLVFLSVFSLWAASWMFKENLD